MKSYVITSAQGNAKVHKNFLNSLHRYCSEKEAELIVLPMKGKTHEEDTLDSLLSEEKILTTQLYLNNKIKISNFEILPQQIDPTTGLARFTHTDHSTIFAATKQRLNFIPNSNYKLPKTLMTTGAVTHPRYRENRIGKIAQRDHKYGAVVVDVVSDKKYHFRHIQATNNGHFVDLGMRYTDDKQSSPATLEALVLGDWHCGDTNPDVKRATYEMIHHLKPKRIFLHDFFNGHSVNPHTKDDLISLSQSYKEGSVSLSRELQDAYLQLRDFAMQFDGEIVVVKSNHDEWLDKYFRSGQFVKNPINSYISSLILPKVIEGQNPLKVGLSLCGELPKQVRFLERDEDYKIMGWQLGCHGDMGPHGTRGTMRGKEYAYGKSITGHSHVPFIFRDTYVVGTSTNLRLDYNQGPSAWFNCHAALYDNGKAQLIQIVDGNWK